MFGIGGTELLVILLVALLVLGPKKLPELARTLGKALGEFRRVSTEFQRNLNTEIAVEDSRKDAAARRCTDDAPPAAASGETPETDAVTGGPAPRSDKDSGTP